MAAEWCQWNPLSVLCFLLAVGSVIGLDFSMINVKIELINLWVFYRVINTITYLYLNGNSHKY